MQASFQVTLSIEVLNDINYLHIFTIKQSLNTLLTLKTIVEDIVKVGGHKNTNFANKRWQIWQLANRRLVSWQLAQMANISDQLRSFISLVQDGPSFGREKRLYI